MTTKEDLSPAARKIYDQIEEDLRAVLSEAFKGKPNDEKNRKLMKERCIEYFEIVGQLDPEEE